MTQIMFQANMGLQTQRFSIARRDASADLVYSI